MHPGVAFLGDEARFDQSAERTGKRLAGKVQVAGHVSFQAGQLDDSSGDCPNFRGGDCPNFRVSENGTVPFASSFASSILGSGNRQFEQISGHGRPHRGARCLP